MFKPEEAWDLVLHQAVKAILTNVMWQPGYNGPYNFVSLTSKELVKIGDTDCGKLSVLTREEATQAAEKLAIEVKIERGKLFDDGKKESLFVLFHPHIKISNDDKYIKIRKKFRPKSSDKI